MQASPTIIDLEKRHLPEMFTLRQKTQSIHHQLFPKLFTEDVHDIAGWHELRAFLPSWNPFHRRVRFAIGCEKDGKLAAYLLYHTEDRERTSDFSAATVIMIWDIAVDEDRRGSGLARALIAEVRRRFAGGVEQTEIWANVWTGNRSSRSLFEGQGFTPLHTTYALFLDVNDGA